ncbi:MAG TPA: hypothetical protein VFF81_03085 [Noviherbaspirillum sp.]|nr:hypothetical protein [Noviherbaspirillum sp.]
MTKFPRVSIAVGVTGHRDILAQEVPVVQAAARMELTRLREKYPASPIILLTALAEGADRIAAHAALEAGIAIGVVLPMPQSEYEADFQTNASVEEFRQLLKRARWSHLVASRESSTNASTERNQRYLDAGIYVAKHSQLLFALWDGDTTEKKGGTAHIVRLYQNGQYSDDEDLLSFPDAGPVVHVFTRRSGRTYSDHKRLSGSVEFLAPVGIEPFRTSRQAKATNDWEKKRWDLVLARINQFNLDAQEFQARHPERIQRSRTYLIGEVAPATLAGSALNALSVYEVADAISAYGNARRLTLFKAIISFAMLSVLFESLYSGPFMEWPLLALCLLNGVGAYSLFRKVRSDRLEERYLDYRALAEGARVQFFWKQAGLQDNAADHYLKEQRDELEWIRQVLRCLELPRVEMPIGAPADDKVAGTRLALDYWVRDQFNYFAGTRQKAQANRTADEKITRQAKALFIGGICVLALTGLFQIFFALRVSVFADNVIQTCIVIYNLLFWALPAVNLYGDIMGYSEHAKRYKKMGYYFGICEQKLAQALLDKDTFRASELLRQIGRQALVENGDWLLLHRQRPVQVPLVE